MRSLTLLLVAGLLALPACEAEDDRESAATPSADERAMDRAADAAEQEERTATAADAADDPTRIRVGGSEFGRMLFDSERQAIYVFQRDPKGRTVCYGACAKAWPPVVTRGEPVAGKGVRERLLGTIKRRGGATQVTYAGRPLYYYAHEAPGEVRCHDVNLNGGYWWVMGPDGRRRP